MSVKFGKIARMPPSFHIPSHVTADAYNRITVPKHLSDCVSWLNGNDTLQAWLLLMSVGRYRLLSDHQVQSDPALEPIRSLILEGKSVSTADPMHAEEPRRAAILARLAPTAVSPPGPGWRISFPKSLGVFVPPECDQKAFTVLFSLEGYLEIWNTEILKRATLLSL